MTYQFSLSSCSYLLGTVLALSAMGCGGGNGSGVSPKPPLGLNSIAFISTRDGSPEIYVMNPDGSEETRVTNGIGSADNPSQSREGHIVFESTRDGNSEIYSVNRDGSNLTRLTNDSGANAASDNYPTFSPDGKTIAWTSNRGQDGIYNVWLMDFNGSNKRQFASGFVATAYPAWSADGKQIAYLVVPDKGGNVGNNGIQLKDVITGKTTEADFRFAGESHLRFNNGTKIISSTEAFLSPTRARTLSIYDFSSKTKSKGPQAQVTPPSKDRSPDYSPDGQSIVWDAIVDDKPSQIYRANSDGSGVQVITTQGENYSPDW